MKSQPTRTIAASLLSTALTCLMGCGENQTATAPSEVESMLPAEELVELMDGSPPPTEPGEFKSEGTVAEIFPAAIKITNEKHPDGVVLAASGAVKVFNGSNEVELATIKQGDKVRTYSERRGNRADGWQTLVVRVDVFSESPVGEANDGDSDTLTDRPGYPTTLQGIFVEADTASITIRSSENKDLKPSVVAVDPSVVVRKAGQSGGTELLADGDILKLTSERRGNRADGWMSIVTDISVVDRD